MILTDTPIWIDHFRARDPLLDVLLASEQVLMHPFILGELALGNLKGRQRTLAQLKRLPEATVAKLPEVLLLIERENLHGVGIGYVDTHLLSSTLLSDAALWTRDKRLQEAAQQMGLAFSQRLN